MLAVLLVSDYAQTRVTTWLNIDAVDPLGAAWQTLQGLYAIGSGGFFGLGFGSAALKGSENNDPFIREDGRIRTSTNNCGGLLGGMAVFALLLRKR